MVFFSWKMFITILCGFLFCFFFLKNFCSVCTLFYYFYCCHCYLNTSAPSAKVFGRCRWWQWKQLSSNSPGFVIKTNTALVWIDSLLPLFSYSSYFDYSVFGTVSNAPLIMRTLKIRFSRLYFSENYNLNLFKSRVNRPHPHNFHLFTYILHTSLLICAVLIRNR